MSRLPVHMTQISTWTRSEGGHKPSKANSPVYQLYARDRLDPGGSRKLARQQSSKPLTESSTKTGGAGPKSEIAACLVASVGWANNCFLRAVSLCPGLV